MHNDLFCVADVTVVLAERKLTSYVYAVDYVCMASKLPLVVPIHISSGLVYNLIKMAFKEGLKVRYSSKYLSVTTRRGKSGRDSLVSEQSSCHPVSQFCCQRHSFDHETPLTFREMEEKLRIFNKTQGVVARYGDPSSDYVMQGRIFRICLPVELTSSQGSSCKEPWPRGS
ncbi:hypothetical protein TIFTF001_039768 [Ficus carica]|uniref:Uncharacterized protein n=1 Tax=Ficus carica TaxID=3494 RepID=A0AA87YWC4_FICCA|nr:hypothetical protein TIFTF001_039768 [Ficus carica]